MTRSRKTAQRPETPERRLEFATRHGRSKLSHKRKQWLRRLWLTAAVGMAWLPAGFGDDALPGVSPANPLARKASTLQRPSIISALSKNRAVKIGLAPQSPVAVPAATKSKPETDPHDGNARSTLGIPAPISDGVGKRDAKESSVAGNRATKVTELRAESIPVDDHGTADTTYLAPIVNAPASMTPADAMGRNVPASAKSNDLPNFAPIKNLATPVAGAPIVHTQRPTGIADTSGKPGAAAQPAFRGAPDSRTAETLPLTSGRRLPGESPEVKVESADETAKIPPLEVTFDRAPQDAIESSEGAGLVDRDVAPKTEENQDSRYSAPARDAIPGEIGRWLPSQDVTIPVVSDDDTAPIATPIPARVEPRERNAKPLASASLSLLPPQTIPSVNSRSDVLPIGTHTEPLHVATKKPLQIRMHSPIRKLEVEDGKICETLQPTPGEIVIVGKKQGETRLAVWLGKESDPQIWCVKVGADEMEQPGNRTNNALIKLVTELYPHCRIKLTNADDKLVVEGQAKDRQEAVQILSLIRSVRLVPVVDRLTVRTR